MAKATTTIKQVLNSQADHAAWFAANQVLFNRVVAFYFEVIQAHEKVLDLSNKDALTALEKLTHPTQSHPAPIMPLEEVAQDLPAMFRRAAINAALGSARSFSSHLSQWRKRKEKAEAKGKKFHERPPVPPRTWNKSVPLYAGMWKERSDSSVVLLTSRVNPKNTSRECAGCHSLVARYAEGQPAEGYTYGAALVSCAQCGMKGNADRNASLVIGQRLVMRYHQEKPPTPLRAKREPKGSGVVVSQEVKSRNRASIQSARHGDTNEHGPAQQTETRMVGSAHDIPHQLRLPLE